MEIKLMSKDTASNIMQFVTSINKTPNMTAIVLPALTEDGYKVIKVESLE
jgi:hypothetical protein